MSIFDLFAQIERKAPSPAGPVRYLIVGLGNPGRQYENTRHNAGFLALDQLERQLGARTDRLQFQSLTGRAQVGETPVLLLRPQTYMNLSGQAVRAAADYYHIPAERIVVLSDDISLPVGTLRVRAKGSAGGQNGLKNIIAQLGTDAFCRVRMGVGQKPHPDYDLADWVLSTFPAPERAVMDRVFDRAAQAAQEIVRAGVQSAMSRFNGSVEEK